MTGTVAGMFLASAIMTGGQHVFLLFPLCLSIAIVYKTTRCENLRDIPMAAIVLFGTIIVGMYAVGAGLWVLFKIMA